MKKDSLHRIFNRPYSSKGVVLAMATKALSEGLLIPKSEVKELPMLFYGLMTPFCPQYAPSFESSFSSNVLITPMALDYCVHFFRGDVIQGSVSTRSNKSELSYNLENNMFFEGLKTWYQESLNRLKTDDFDFVTLKLVKTGPLREAELKRIQDLDDNFKERHDQQIARTRNALTRIDAKFLFLADCFEGYENLEQFFTRHEKENKKDSILKLPLTYFKDVEELELLEKLSNQREYRPWSQEIQAFRTRRETRTHQIKNNLERWKTLFKAQESI